MFDEIGKKIKGLAKIVTIIGIVASCIAGLVTMVEAENFLMGLLLAAVGSLVSWVGSFLLYGFGELIDLTSDNNYLLEQIGKSEKNTRKDINDLVNVTVAKKEAPATKAESPVEKFIGSCTPTRVDSLRIQCPKCKTVQMANNPSCSQCGVRFL